MKNKQQRVQENKVNSSKTLLEVLRFGLFGAVGFGIGAIIGIVITGLLFNIFTLNRSYHSFVLLFIVGAIGGASLGIPFRDWKKVRYLSIGNAFIIPISLTLQILLLLSWTNVMITWALTGAIIGTFNGLVLIKWIKSWKVVLFLLLTAAIGFSIGHMVRFIPSLDWRVRSNIVFISLITLYAFLGAALGYLKNKDLIE